MFLLLSLLLPASIVKGGKCLYNGKKEYLTLQTSTSGLLRPYVYVMPGPSDDSKP